MLKTEERSSIKGIGGTARGKVVEFEIDNRYGIRAKIRASVVDEITTIRNKDRN